MNTIYTAGEVDPQALALLLKECDELRAALKERDAEIERLKIKETDWTAAYQAEYQEATRAIVRVFQLATKLTSQRKVLEHVLDTLTTVYGLGTETPIIKEIQEILK